MFLADVALHQPVLIKSTAHVNVEVRADAGRDVDNLDIDDSEPELVADVVLSVDLTDTEAREHSLVATCFQLVHAVHARPPADAEED